MPPAPAIPPPPGDTAEARLEPVRRALRALGAGDLAALLAVAAPGIRLDHAGGNLPHAGRHEGAAGLRDYLRRRAEAVAVIGFEPAEMAPAGADRVLVLGHEHLRCRRTGLERRGPWVHLYVLEGGRIAGLTIWSDGAGQRAAHRGH